MITSLPEKHSDSENDEAVIRVSESSNSDVIIEISESEKNRFDILRPNSHFQHVRQIMI